MGVPLTRIFSLSPSSKPLTVKVKPVIVWPASTVPIAAPLNTATAAACVEPAPSVKVGLAAVAVRVGASLTAITFTVEVRTLELSALSFTTKLTVRAAVVGAFELLA